MEIRSRLDAAHLRVLALRKPSGQFSTPAGPTMHSAIIDPAGATLALFAECSLPPTTAARLAVAAGLGIGQS